MWGKMWGKSTVSPPVAEAALRKSPCELKMPFMVSRTGTWHGRLAWTQRVGRSALPTRAVGSVLYKEFGVQQGGDRKVPRRFGSRWTEIYGHQIPQNRIWELCHCQPRWQNPSSADQSAPARCKVVSRRPRPGRVRTRARRCRHECPAA